MHHHYNDITSRITERPKWYDENAVPRYSEPGPREVAHIYADEVAFVRIRCQACGHPTLVAFSSSVLLRFKWRFGPNELGPTLEEQIKDGSLHYGDPPNACPGERTCAGPSMNCIDERVEQYWRQNKRLDWERVPELEINLDRRDDDDGQDN